MITLFETNKLTYKTKFFKAVVNFLIDSVTAAFKKMIYTNLLDLRSSFLSN